MASLPGKRKNVREKNQGTERRMWTVYKINLLLVVVKKQNGVVLSCGQKRKAIIYTDISEYEANGMCAAGGLKWTRNGWIFDFSSYFFSNLHTISEVIDSNVFASII